jgi:hypothetical protein
MISCKKATELISRSQDEELSPQEALSLKIHLFICECCAQFQKHTGILRQVLRRPHKSGGEPLDPQHRISESLRKRIKDSIAKAGKGSDQDN